MKKALFCAIFALLGLTFSSQALAATPPQLEGLFGLGDPKTQISYYDVNSVWKYYCFTGECYDITTDKLAFVKDIEPAITDLQNRVGNLENQPMIPVVSSSASLPIDTAKASRVKDEVQTYLNGLNQQYSDIENSEIPLVGIFHHETNDEIVISNQYADKILVKDVPSIKQYPAGFPDNSRKFYVDSVAKLVQIDTAVKHLNTITYEIDDYSSTGVLPSASDRAYLQSLGINW